MQGDFFYRRFGERVVYLRKMKGMSQEELSSHAQMDRTYLARIERGRVNPTLRILHKITRAMKLPLSVLFWGV